MVHYGTIASGNQVMRSAAQETRSARSSAACVEWKAMPRSMLPRVHGGLQIEEAIGTLCGYSFLARRDHSEIEEEEEEWYDIHRLVQLATRV
jgi:hypothetical protein